LTRSGFLNYTLYLITWFYMAVKLYPWNRKQGLE
jgi:hypothetical protein